MSSVAAALEVATLAKPAPVERVRQRARRQVLWMRHLWAQGATSLDQGLSISHGEVDRELSDPDSLADERNRFFASDPGARQLREAIASADQNARHDREWSAICDCFGLAPHESDLLALAIASEIDPGLGRVYGYLHDDVQACHATQWLAEQLFENDQAIGCGPESALMRWRLAVPMEGSRNPWGARTPWLADGAVALGVQHKAWREPVVEMGLSLENSARHPQCIHPAALERLRRFSNPLDKGWPIELEIVGPGGSGKRTLAAQLAGERGRPLLVADAQSLLAGKADADAGECVIRVLRAARALGAIVHWRNADILAAGALRPAQGLYDLAFFDRTSPSSDPPLEGVLRETVHLAPLTMAQRLAVWEAVCEAPVPTPVVSRQLIAGEIVSAARVCHLGEEAIRRACRPALLAPPDLLQPLPCPYEKSDLVLLADTMRQLEEFEQQARLRWPVYEEWGFEKLCSQGKGVTALFAGESGTGKTMSAQVIARSLELELVRVDLSGVVNKYIGETEKRLKQVFDYCERANVMLLFDEADALFGQRMQVKDAHDRFANIEIDYLLQRMEQFSGVAVLATNRKNDLDKAFLRRLRFIIDFMPPGAPERLGLWRRALLTRSPSGQELLGEIDWTFLAEKLTMTGADIKAAALGAAFLARAEGTRIGMPHIIAAARREMIKHGFVLRANLGEQG